jgi:hypothetical protein
MCCNLSIDELKLLIPKEVINVDLIDNNVIKSVSCQKSQGGNSNNTIGTKSCQFPANNVPEVHGTFDMDEEESHYRRLRDITDVLHWDAKCKGVTYLGEDEFINHDRSVKLSKFSSWK